MVEVLRQLEKKTTPIVSFKLAFLLENLVDSAERRDVARFVEQMMKTKILQCLHALLRVRKSIVAEGPLPPLIRPAAQAGIDGKEIEINELLSAALGWKPIGVAQTRFPTAKGFFVRRLDDRSIC